MRATDEEIRAQQRESWNRFSQGWKKWDHLTMKFLEPPGKVMLESIDWAPHFSVLDCASGTGEPALTASKKVPKGRVVATDVAKDMLALAEEKAAQLNLSNFQTKVCSADEIPFDAASFDVVTSRMGYMFFPDILKAAVEMSRVLKPGGYLSVSVWSGPEKNPWISGLMRIIREHVDVPVPEKDAPGVFRCAEPGYLQPFLQQAGFREISERLVEHSMNCTSPNQYWDFMADVAAPVVDLLETADKETIHKIQKAVIAEAAKFESESGVSFPALSVVVSARK
jgi:ubiquinone/menaquinone biosynthesis C-methylase UbiE